MQRYRQPYETAGPQRRPKSDPLAPQDLERAMADVTDPDVTHDASLRTHYVMQAEADMARQRP